MAMSKYITESLPPEALELFSILPVDYEGEDNLKLAEAYVRKYRETRHTHDWFDVRVSAVCFASFLQAVTEDNNNNNNAAAAAAATGTEVTSAATTLLLPFSCWCDGGEDYCSSEQDGDDDETHKYRQHRHVIAVAPKAGGHFENRIWARVFCESRPKAKYPSKKKFKIESAGQLVDVLLSLCEGQSDCQFTYNDPLTASTPDRNFYIFKKMPIPVDQCMQKLYRVISDAIYKDACKTIKKSLTTKKKVLTERDREMIREIRDFLNLDDTDDDEE